MTRARRALVALVLPALLVGTAACDNGPARPEAAGSSRAPAPAPAATAAPGPGATTRPASNPRSPSSSAAAPADPSHAVDPPGPRTGALSYGDILIYDPDSLGSDTISAIRHLPGVASAEPLAIAQVSIENTVLNLAAVDPATYRNFTPAGSADTQAVWDRVAGGELAIRPELQRKVPIDAEGYLRLGSDRNAPRVHVGAFAPQIDGAIDAVVNESWIPTLGMKPDNALIVSTGQRAPLSLRKPIERLAGDQASVQMLDIVARAGLDTSAQQTAFLVGSVADAVGTFNYTVLGGGRVAPGPLVGAQPHRAPSTVPILGSVTCNRLIFPQLRGRAHRGRRSADWPTRSTPREYAGCYYPRFIAGTTSAVHPLLRPRPRPQRAGQPARHGRARWTARSSRSSRSGASPGAATGTTPTRCTSR